MELNIYNQSEVKNIEFNFDELKSEVLKKLEKYEGITYDKGAIKIAKDDRAKLNKFKNALEDKRKEVKEQCLLPYFDFERKIKEIVNLVDKPINLIDKQVKNYEEEVKENKKNEIRNFFDLNIQSLKGIILLDDIFNSKWLNTGYDMVKIESEILDTLKKIKTDIDVIISFKSPYHAILVETYLDTFDLSSVLKKKNDIETREKNPIVFIQSEVNANEEVKRTDEVLEFRVYVNYLQKQSLKDFFIKNNIKFERI